MTSSLPPSVSSASVRNILALLASREAQLVAGTGGLERRVTWACRMRARLPAFESVQGGELALLALSQLRRLDETLPHLLKTLHKAGVSAVAVAAQSLAALGDEAISIADHLHLPLILLGIGLMLMFGEASFHFHRHRGSLFGSLFGVSASLVLNIILMIIAMVAAAKFTGIYFGKIPTAILKIAAVYIAPTTLGGLLTEVLGGELPVQILGYAVNFILIWALLAYLFRLDGSQTMACVMCIGILSMITKLFLVGTMLSAVRASMGSADADATEQGQSIQTNE